MEIRIIAHHRDHMGCDHYKAQRRWRFLIFQGWFDVPNTDARSAEEAKANAVSQLRPRAEPTYHSI